MKITVDPNTDAGGFGYAEAGRYQLRVVKAEVLEGPQAPYIKWTCEFADPNVKAVDEKKKVGNVFENTTLKSEGNAQFRLRQMCDALDLTWGDFDTDDVIGMEFQAEIDVDMDYNPDNPTNKIKRCIPVEI